MIHEGQMRNRPHKLGHNCSFFIIVANLGLKVGWGDFSEADLHDRTFQSHSYARGLVGVPGLDVNLDESKILVPAGMPIYVLTEGDSYWDARERGAVLLRADTPALDPNSRSAFRDSLPPDMVIFDGGYVRAFARWVFDQGVLKTRSLEELEAAQVEWQEAKEKTS